MSPKSLEGPPAKYPCLFISNSGRELSVHMPILRNRLEGIVMISPDSVLGWAVHSLVGRNLSDRWGQRHRCSPPAPEDTAQQSHSLNVPPHPESPRPSLAHSPLHLLSCDHGYPGGNTVTSHGWPAALIILVTLPLQ